jgi:hypothetical protein
MEKEEGELSEEDNEEEDEQPEVDLFKDLKKREGHFNRTTSRQRSGSRNNNRIQGHKFLDEKMLRTSSGSRNN